MKRLSIAGALGLVAAAGLFASSGWSASGPSDAQIAAIVVVANQVDVDAGELAKSKTQSAEVRDFAQRMIVDHGGVNDSATALAAKLHLTPESNPTSEKLKQGGEENLVALKALDGAAFDRAYVAHEVSYHEAVLGAVDSTLIPNAKNAELKALLVKVRPVFVSHLEHAKQLQASLGKSGR